MTVFQKVKFGDLYSTPSRNGVSKPSRIRGAGYPMVNMGEIFKYSRIDDSVDMELVPLSDIEMGNSFLENGDLLFARQSLVLEGAGKCSIFLGNNTKTTFESHLIRARLDINKTESKFYYYYFTSSPGKTKIRSIVNQVAAAGIRGSDLAKLVVDFPNLPTQTRIASVLSTYDDLIENNEKRIKTLEEMAQLLYTEWFVKFKFPGHEKVKMVESGTEYGMAPEGWEVKRLGEIITPQYGYTESAVENDDFPKYLRGTDINKKSFIDWQTVPNCKIIDEDFKKYKVNKGDVFIIRMADPGKIGICEQEVKAVFASYLMRLNIKERLTPYYLYYFAIQKRYQGFVLGASGGTTRKSVNSQQVGAIDILIPKQEILDIFEMKIGILREELTKLIQQNNSLSKTRDLLIPQLVTGRRELK